ncbi:Uu.00g038750.m01.CDS01 [Anthostomella pinea]|uniref:Uu.00g038750.m01.CDS01 n=1 Tax=Anthostomella pinea TaxID=933095 RepID=A0AAI8VAD2_9PEZI|nr:Uu.00g038750.m01.CDS01 [Anthostomella pinea]
MQFSIASIVLAALAGLATAEVSLTNSAYSVTVGQPFDITWTGAEGPVRLVLKTGPSENLADVDTIADGQTGTSYSWTPPSTLTAGSYAIQISDDSSTNYSPQFDLVGGAASATSSSTTVAMTTSTAEPSTTDAATTATQTTSETTDAATATESTASTTASSAASNSMGTTMSTAVSSTVAAGATKSSSSSASASATGIAQTNGAAGAAAPFLAPLLFAAVAALV